MSGENGQRQLLNQPILEQIKNLCTVSTLPLVAPKRHFLPYMNFGNVLVDMLAISCANTGEPMQYRNPTLKVAVDKSPERIQGMFDSIAPWYDFLNHVLSLGIDHRWRKRTAREVLTADTPPGPVLDVCCGTGDLTLAMWKRQNTFQRPRDFFGLDFSEKMLEIGRQKCERITKRTRKNAASPVGSITLEQGDALALPFENDRFAAVTIAFGLRNVASARQGLTEMARVCKPGGTVAVLEFSMPTTPGIAFLYRFYFRHILPRLGQCLARRSDDAYHYLPKSVTEFMTPAELRDQFDHFGLIDIQSFPLTFGIATLTLGRVSPIVDKHS